ncbi:DUF4332 domain-containing protein [Streptomyces sp. MB09-01]|uniref:DUF4332 domain-containing protein n=1 Tax=Streptomyces sp. MB09-01 TaxID=3028666 RepID=UPI0029BF1264|nr:DUF4332 domain-containing protein [Streptomyces sp. MB09-01]MDX3534008.1 DUF4332 domain-containing protein [Streptomyces sp. MB09-01]
MVAPARAASLATPFDAGAESICATAKGHQNAGSLDRAKALYMTVQVGDGEKNCAVAGLKSVAEQRQQAAEAVVEGQRLVRSGDLDDAQNQFRAALELDRTNAKAAAGIAKVAILKGRPNATASSNWDRFYKDWVEPVGKLLLFSAMAWALLYALAGLFSRWFVRVDAVIWPTGKWRFARDLGLFLISGVAVMLPVYAMFKPFTVGGPLIGWAAGVITVIGLGMLFLVVSTSAPKRQHETDGIPQRDWRHWSVLLGGLALVVVMADILLLSPLPEFMRLMAAYIALALIGVMVVSSTLGQRLRLQVEVQRADGTVCAASTEYLLARMKGLGTEAPKQLDRASSVLATTPLSKITSEDLSALPAGKIASTLSRLLFALRPDLTWHARVTLVDDDRSAVTLIRNGRHVESIVVSRPDLGLSVIPAELGDAARTRSQDRARAQKLTAVAAFILLRLSEVHVDLRDDLCGARHWRSLALQVIATSKSLIDDSEEQSVDERVELLSLAVDEDPGYVLACFEYLRAVYQRIPEEETDEEEYRKYATAIDQLYARAGLWEIEDTAEGWVPLRIRVMYSSATQWLNSCMASGESNPSALVQAARSAWELKRLCERRWEGRRLRQRAEHMRPFAENLWHCIEALYGVGPDETRLHPHEHAPYSPRLAYDHACLDCLLARRRAGCWGCLTGQSRKTRWLRLDQALEDLEFAVATDDDKTAAATDPFFDDLHSNDRFRRLVNVPPLHFLDLSIFASYKTALAKAGITSAFELVRRSQSGEQQDQLAAHLQVSRPIIDQMRDVALLAQVHPDLEDPGMLHLLLAEGVSSSATLRDQASRSAKRLVHQLRSRAKKENLAYPPGLRQRRCRRWLRAAQTQEPVSHTRERD